MNSDNLSAAVFLGNFLSCAKPRNEWTWLKRLVVHGIYITVNAALCYWTRLQESVGLPVTR